MFRECAPKVMDKELQEIDGEIRNDQELHTRSDIEIKTDAVGANGGAGSHQKFSLRGKTRGVKEAREKRQQGCRTPRRPEAATREKRRWRVPGATQSSFLRAK